ncbi:MAG TPA: 2-isopropylmalate synthase [bacterium]|nr:2-isopropylmalate synthase [bacterium]HPR89436.1 2-isopropylmalate synthase [bacterium]
MSQERIIIFDTTLRDGEQSPGASLGVNDKLTIAEQLARLKVDVIEAGFPVSSQAQFDGVRLIAGQVKGPAIAALARCIDKDIDAAGEALKGAERPRIHTFVATSKIHLEKKFRKNEAEVLEMAVAGVRRAKRYCEEVEFSPEDSSRTGLEFLLRIVEAAIAAGATVINIPDTVGFAMPEQFGTLIRTVRERVPNIHKAVLSVHCHNDLGMAVANTLAAVQNGAGQVEVTVNGVGERAGNASLEEVVMALKTRADFYSRGTGIETREILRTSKMVSSLMGIPVQPNKAIVGANAFAHESGIHQDAVIKDATTYEIMTPQEIGLSSNAIVLGRHSGRHGLKTRLEELGYVLQPAELDHLYQRFLEIADRKKEVFDDDLLALMSAEMAETPETWKLDYFHILSGNKTVPTATVGLRRGEACVQEAAVGDGPVDAAYNALNRIVNLPVTLQEYSLRGVTGGKEAIGEVVVRVRHAGIAWLGRGASTDIIEASIRAYLHALNRIQAAAPDARKNDD